ncbi:MAG: hypothetical protein KDC44_03175 [Phaeodactylibacter sp.]|nr:hypothetical protein [Phaeodactylibacter sp.]
MNQFTFESKQKTVLMAFMALGVVCLGLSWVFDDPAYHHARFWTNFLHNATFFTGIALMTLFFISASVTAWAGWYTVFKRVWESFTAFLVPGFVLMLVIIAGLWLGWHEIYHWADTEEVAKDRILSGKASFLNKNWYTFGTIIIMAIWILFARRIRQLSLEEEKSGGADYKFHHKTRVWAAAFLPIAGFSSAALIWQWIMSVDSHWYSTLYAWYSGASWFVAAMALTILLLIYLKSLGYFENVTAEHFHDLGKFLFAFSIFWTYLWFSQFMLIWYANNGEETIYFHQRMQDYPVLFYGNLVINFMLPFLILMRNDTKRKNGTMVLAAVLVFVGHWMDFFLMIKPGALITAQHAAHAAAEHGAEGHGEAAGHGAEHAAEMVEHASEFVAGFSIPGLLEIGVMLGFLALFLYVVLNNLTKAPLQPANDPYIDESLHHHVGYGGGPIHHHGHGAEAEHGH